MIRPGSSWHVRVHWSDQDDWSGWVTAVNIEDAYNTIADGLERKNVRVPIGAKVLVRHESSIRK